MQKLTFSELQAMLAANRAAFEYEDRKFVEALEAMHHAKALEDQYGLGHPVSLQAREFAGVVYAQGKLAFTIMECVNNATNERYAEHLQAKESE